MPAVVSEYIRKNTFEGSLDTQKQLISDYREDIRKYAEGVDQTRIINVFNRIAPQLARENKKFQISKVAPGARFRASMVTVTPPAELSLSVYGMAFTVTADR